MASSRPVSRPRRGRCASHCALLLLASLALLLVLGSRGAAAAGPVASSASDPFAFEPEVELVDAKAGEAGEAAEEGAGGEGHDGEAEVDADAAMASNDDDDDDDDAETAAEDEEGEQDGDVAVEKAKKKKKKIHTSAGTKRRRRTGKTAPKVDPSRMRANERREYEARVAAARAKAREEVCVVDARPPHSPCASLTTTGAIGHSSGAGEGARGPGGEARLAGYPGAGRRRGASEGDGQHDWLAPAQAGQERRA